MKKRAYLVIYIIFVISLVFILILSLTDRAATSAKISANQIENVKEDYRIESLGHELVNALKNDKSFFNQNLFAKKSGTYTFSSLIYGTCKANYGYDEDEEKLNFFLSQDGKNLKVSLALFDRDLLNKEGLYLADSKLAGLIKNSTLAKDDKMISLNKKLIYSPSSYGEYYPLDINMLEGQVSSGEEDDKDKVTLDKEDDNYDRETDPTKEDLPGEKDRPKVYKYEDLLKYEASADDLEFTVKGSPGRDRLNGHPLLLEEDMAYLSDKAINTNGIICLSEKTLIIGDINHYGLLVVKGRPKILKGRIKVKGGLIVYSEDLFEEKIKFEKNNKELLKALKYYSDFSQISVEGITSY